VTAGEEQQFVVAEGAAIPGLRVEAERARLRGRRVVAGWEGAGPQTASLGLVTDASSATQALVAALAGADLLIEAWADGSLVDRLCDDLRRLGRVVHRTGEPGDERAIDGLDDDVIALLSLLAQGVSLGDAAARLHLSRRTADRRLADARKVLGVRGTVEAVAALRGS
jgi:DNA-binding NarL/FixJ family response regulator